MQEKDTQMENKNDDFNLYDLVVIPKHIALSAPAAECLLAGILIRLNKSKILVLNLIDLSQLKIQY